jgi:hypothetical protein
MRSQHAIISSIEALTAAAPAGLGVAPSSDDEDTGLLQLVSQQLQQRLLPRWSSRWPAIHSSNGAAQMLVVLGLRRQFLQCLQLQETWQPQHRQQLGSVIDVGFAEMQLQASADMAAYRCTDPARVLLREHEADVQRLRAAQLIRQQQAGVLDARRCIVAVEVSIAQLQACPGDSMCRRLLEQNMQVGALHCNWQHPRKSDFDILWPLMRCSMHNVPVVLVSSCYQYI